MPYEVEQKFQLAHPAALTAKLAALGAMPPCHELQRDQFFAHPQRNFRVTDEAFRVRQVDDRNIITYKGPKIDLVTKTRRELEVDLAPGADAFAQFTQIMTALGFMTAGRVEKHRASYQLQWQEHAAHVTIDEVTGLGTFAEIELIADDDAMEAAKAALLSLASELGLGNPERRSYLEMLETGADRE